MHVCVSEIVWRMASRRGLEPLTPGLGTTQYCCQINALLFSGVREFKAVQEIQSEQVLEPEWTRLRGCEARRRLETVTAQ